MPTVAQSADRAGLLSLFKGTAVLGGAGRGAAARGSRRKKFDQKPAGRAGHSVGTFRGADAASSSSATQPRLLCDGRLAGTSRMSSVALLNSAAALAARGDRSSQHALRSLARDGGAL